MKRLTPAFAMMGLFALFAAAPRAHSTGSGSAISGMQTEYFDYDANDYTTFHLAWASSGSAIELTLIKNPNETIGNYYLTEHYLIYGTQFLNPPITLDWPFYGHNLLIVPDDILGPFPGGTSVIPVPNDPNLIGMTFLFQGLATFITTVHFPIEPEYVLQNGVKGTFF